MGYFESASNSASVQLSFLSAMNTVLIYCDVLRQSRILSGRIIYISLVTIEKII